MQAAVTFINYLEFATKLFGGGDQTIVTKKTRDEK